MEIEFASDELRRLYEDRALDKHYPPGVAQAYRKRIQFIRAAPTERSFYTMTSLHFERLRRREDQHSMRLNKQFRLVLTLLETDAGKKVRIIGVEDYH